MSQAAMDWDLTSYFPAFDDPSMRQFKDELKRDIDALRQRAAALGGAWTPRGRAWDGVSRANLPRMAGRGR